MKTQIIEKLSLLITASFGFVAALAWNEAIKGMFTGPCGIESAGILCELSVGGPWVYAIIVTAIATIVTIWIGKISEKK
ncbi:MAG: DUF5654 family protein [archaeon]